MAISPDALAILLLCSHFGLPSDPAEVVAPLTLREWNPLARTLQTASLHPGDLLGMSAVDLQNRLSLAEIEASRLAHLLERISEVAK